MLLRVEGLATHYGRIRALEGVSLTVGAGELVTIVGANGAGKTTLLRTISGLRPVTAGRIRFDDRDITHRPAAERVRLGIAQVPEGRRVWGPMSVEDNLLLGGWTRPRGELATSLGEIYALFPRLAERRRQPAGSLSGGEQQMLAIGRALMAKPRLLLLDEPSMGLAPRLVETIFATIADLRQRGTTILLVEQNAFAALSLADRGYVLESGRVVLEGPAAELLADRRVQAAYLGL
ncbi:High-affinity branched-chain amino acid transport ATP-binding protein LivF [bacterium HR40]|nr:High-affinity branched-chain amino acid transport ATP-binding protein LivF [bacterium HR40]